MVFGFLEFIPLVVIGLIILAVANTASGRQDPDPTGRRPYAIYLVSVIFVSLLMLLFSATAVVSELASLAVGGDEIRPYAVLEEGGYGSSSGTSVVTAPPPQQVGGSKVQPSPLPPNVTPEPLPAPDEVPPPRPIPIGDSGPNNERIRGAILAGLIALIAASVLRFHARRLRELINEQGFVEGPARRAYQVYLYTVCFVSVLTLLVAGAVAAYGLVRIIAPGTTGIGRLGSFERDEGIRQFVTGAFLTLATSAIFRFHWQRAAAFRTPPPEEPRPEAAPPV